MKKFDPFLLLAISIFSLLFLPFVNALPYMDGNIDFVQSYDFYTGGVTRYFQNWGSVHPLFKLWLTNIFYSIFGIHPFFYNLLGFLFGIIGIISIFGLTKILINKHTAQISALLLSTSSMFLACSLFAMRDLMLTSLIIASLYFYSQRRYLWYGLAASALVLTKETGLLLPISVLLIEGLYLLLSLRKANSPFAGADLQSASKHFVTSHKFARVHRRIIKYCFLLLPIFTFLLWLLYLNLNHQKAWSDWLFSPTANKGTFYTIFYNLLTFSFLNQYAYQQCLHLFVLNFNWVYWLIVIIGFLLGIRKISAVRHLLYSFPKGSQQTKTIIAIMGFFLTYFFSVLTIQTYTIPRYILPLVPFLLLATAWSMTTIAKRNHYLAGVLGGIVFLTTIVSLFYSIDPLSQKLWGNIQVFDQTLYGLNNSLSGNDGITYNMQYMLIAAERSKYFYSSTDFPKQQYFQTSCDWMLKDPNNDIKMIHILNLKNFPFITACTEGR